MIIKVPAKLNLRLSCIGLTSNNYHILNMVNCRISLYDELQIEEDVINKVTFSIPEYNNMPNNICLRILNDMCDIYNIKKRYYIHIIKEIPSGAGLGGGSCDAASIINYLDKDNNLNLTMKEKESFGLKYGADIPYCLHNDLCFVRGIGEEVIPFNETINEKFYLIYPNIFLSTKEVYENNNIYSKEDDFNLLKSYIAKKDFESLIKNDLDISSNELCRDLFILRNELSKYGKIFMTGSGSTLILKSDKDIYKELILSYPNYFIREVCSLN